MPATTATWVGKPVWVDLASSDAATSRDFYARLFGWQVEVSPDPQYGGYATARLAGRGVAGIGPKQSPEAPSAWALYIGTDELDALADKVTTAGGTVVVAPFAVGDQGRMAVFADPVGAVISAWEPSPDWQAGEQGFHGGAPNTFGWAELSARAIETAIPFYREVFGWTARKSATGAGGPAYTEFEVDGESIAGGLEMPANVPAEVPSYWMVYFGVDDVDRAFRQALDAGAEEMVEPQDFPGGRFAILRDPQGAMFGLLRLSAAT